MYTSTCCEWEIFLPGRKLIRKGYKVERYKEPGGHKHPPFTATELSCCKFCIFFHSVNSKFTTCRTYLCFDDAACYNTQGVLTFYLQTVVGKEEEAPVWGKMHEQLTVHCCYGTDKRLTQKEIVFQNIFYTSLQNYRINQNIQKGVRFVKNLRQRYRYISFIEWPSTSIVMLTSIGVIQSIS